MTKANVVRQSGFKRVTKWIRKTETIKTGEWGVITGEKWVHNESEQMQERTGNECIVRVSNDGRLAIYRDM